MPAPRHHHRNKPSKGRHHSNQHSRGFEDDAYLQQQQSTLPSINDIKHQNDEGSDDPDAAAADEEHAEGGEGGSSSSTNAASSSIRLAMWDLGQCDKKRCTGEGSLWHGVLLVLWLPAGT